MIDDILTIAKVEINDINTIYLSDTLIIIATVNIFSDKLRGTEKHTLEISDLCLVLYLNEIELTLLILGKHINSVLLVVSILLVAFTLQELLYLNGVAKERSQKALKHSKVGFITQQPFHCPVEADIFLVVVVSHTHLYYDIFRKDRIKSSNMEILKENNCH